MLVFYKYIYINTYKYIYKGVIFIKEYYGIELSILSCLILKPELMSELILEDKHFIKYQRIWQYMKSFYNKYKTFDLQIMFAVCKNKYELMDYIEKLVINEVDVDNFNLYQNELLKSFEENKKERWIKNKVFVLANELINQNIDLKEFDLKYKKLYEDVNILFKGE